VKAYVATAMAQLGQGRTSDAADTYRKLEPISGAGRSFATTGLADLAMYEGRLADAEQILTPAIAAPNRPRARTTPRDGSCRSVTCTSGAATCGGPSRPPIAPRRLSKDLGVMFLAARNFIDAGQTAKAEQLAASLRERLDDEPQIYAKLIEGEVLFKQGRHPEAAARYRDAQKIGDSWLGRYDLGRAYLEAGQYAEAYSEFEKCLERRGEATAIFLDDIPTYRFFAPVHYYIGRAQEGQKIPAAAESYKTFLAIKEKGDEQGIVADARKRLSPQ